LTGGRGFGRWGVLVQEVQMTWNDRAGSGEEPQDRSAAALSAAAQTAQQALESAKGTAQQALDGARGIVSQTHLDEVGSRAAAAASDLYRQGRDHLPDSEELAEAAEQLSGAIRKNPLAAIGIAFSAGLVLALLARG
jgi:ElaB/YqjD/DUF883 family membrane-anchored ribosome-binding protein